MMPVSRVGQRALLLLDHVAFAAVVRVPFAPTWAIIVSRVNPVRK